ncbi:putative aminotransferase C6B12.04c [Cladobotryum mycophilum]|uniref:Aminotransferase C6B12.04c n=1 Tax=Cladobotryum mycophilum TaxID=491253 RepID=A0ABR0T006_9HYPO
MSQQEPDILFSNEGLDSLELWESTCSPEGRSMSLSVLRSQPLRIATRSPIQRALRAYYSTMSGSGKLKPAARVSGQKQDVWSIINEAAAASPKQPIVNMGQGFFGYNPPKFILDAAKAALDQVDCNQYSPTKGRPRLKKAIADAYSPYWGREINPETEVTITTGANEGMLSAFMAFIEPGDEVIIFEPFFDQWVTSYSSQRKNHSAYKGIRYISNIEMPGGKIVYVPLHPPKTGAVKTSSAADWTIDFDELERAITPKTKMIVINTPHNPVGKVYSKDELQKIGDLCVKHEIIILSDEVYDRLYYVPFTRISTLSPEVERLTLTVGSAGKNFYATGWRVGWLMGPEHLIKYVSAAHTRICYSSVSPLQEACAVGFEQAEAEGFWDETIRDMKAKMNCLNEVWDELGLPYSEPEGGYFVLVNMNKVKFPEDYSFPPHVASRPRDFKLAWFLIQELGVAAIPPTEFYTNENAHLAEDYIRFAVCKEDEVLEEAKSRLRGLKKYMVE